MKHYYLFIECGSVLDSTAHFYKVPIGVGKQDTRDYLTLTALAADRGYYFKLWDNETTLFLFRCLDSVWGSHDSMVIASHLALISCRELCKVLHVGSNFENAPSTLTNASHLMKYLNINYRFGQGRKK